MVNIFYRGYYAYHTSRTELVLTYDCKKFYKAKIAEPLPENELKREVDIHIEQPARSIFKPVKT